MGRRGKATGGDLVKLWLIAAVVITACSWTLSQSDIVCDIGPNGSGAGVCVATSISHAIAPYAVWGILLVSAMTATATVLFAVRRR